MLNPSEISNKQFEKVRGRGYRPEEVDAFLAQIAREWDTLLRERQELEQKMLVLADSLEEYKRDEDSLRSALIGAQKLGDSVVREAKAKAQQLEEDAAVNANLMIENAKKEIERQQQGYVRMQREVATFKSKLQLLYKQHLELISSIPSDETLSKPSPSVTASAAAAPTQDEIPEEPVNMAAEQTEPNYEETPAPASDPIDAYDIPIPVDTGLEYAAEEEHYTKEVYPPEPVHQETTSRFHRGSRFGPLKFGSNFDLKHEDERRKK